MPANRHLALGSENRFFEIQRDVFAQISAALGATATPAASSEHIAESEEVAKDVTEILEDRGIESGRSSPRASDAGVTKTIVSRALVGVGQNRIGLAAFCEFFFGVGIVGIAVRMVGQRQLAIGAFDLLIGSCTGNSQDLVIVAFSVTGQNGPSP
jgi:hypothetical protein